MSKKKKKKEKSGKSLIEFVLVNDLKDFEFNGKQELFMNNIFDGRMGILTGEKAQVN